MADSEDTTQSSSTSSAGTTAKRKPTRRRTGARKSSGRKTTARKTTARKTTTRKTASGSRKRSRSGARRKASRAQAASLAGLLTALQKRASGAGSRIAELSGEGASAAKKAVGEISASSRRTIQGVKREWSRMDKPTKVKFVAALLGTLAAASGTVVASRRRKN